MYGTGPTVPLVPVAQQSLFDWASRQICLVTANCEAMVHGITNVNVGHEVIIATKLAWLWRGAHALNGGWAAGAAVLPGHGPTDEPCALAFAPLATLTPIQESNRGGF